MFPTDLWLDIQIYTYPCFLNLMHNFNKELFVELEHSAECPNIFKRRWEVNTCSSSKSTKPNWLGCTREHYRKIEAESLSETRDTTSL